jgi:hypothetical protein
MENATRLEAKGLVKRREKGFSQSLMNPFQNAGGKLYAQPCPSQQRKDVFWVIDGTSMDIAQNLRLMTRLK